MTNGFALNHDKSLQNFFCVKCKIKTTTTTTTIIIIIIITLLKDVESTVAVHSGVYAGYTDILMKCVIVRMSMSSGI